MTEPIKTGYLTTEFWLVILTNFIVVINLFHPLVVQGAVLNNIASLLVLGATGVSYIMGRSKVKAVNAVTSSTKTTTVEAKL